MVNRVCAWATKEKRVKMDTNAKERERENTDKMQKNDSTGMHFTTQLLAS